MAAIHQKPSAKMAVVTISLGFMPSRIVEQSLRAYVRLRNKELPYRHYFVDQHYPINREENRLELQRICRDLGIGILDAGKNLGLHGGFNWALQQLGLHRDDIVIGYDPDSLPITHGFDMALVRAIQGDPRQNTVWASLMNPRSELDLRARGFNEGRADGYIETWATKTAVTNSVCAWHYGWLKDVGFLEEPRAFYGHLEAAMWNKLRGKAWVFVPGWRESDELRDLHDRQYVVYKWMHSHTGEWPGDFESWLRAGSPQPRASTAPNKIP